MTVECPECEGRGILGPRFPEILERAEDFKCRRCDGSGKIESDRDDNILRLFYSLDEEPIRALSDLWDGQPLFLSSSRPGG